MRFFVLFLMIFSLGFAQENNSFLEKLPHLLKEEKWEEIVLSGEESLLRDVSDSERFSVLDQLISSYFRLGSFDIAKEKASELVKLGALLNQPAAVVDSFYKLSAALRGAADSEKDPVKQRELFTECYAAIEKAFAICEEKCSDNKALKARVLFNRGAVHCDDPMGDVHLGIIYYKEAILLFKELAEEDFVQRMSIRLGKAYFLTGQLDQSYELIKELKLANIEKRTYMHLLYLEAQVFLAKEEKEKALELALQGKEIAILLGALHDKGRFEAIIEKIMNQENNGSSDKCVPRLM